MASARIDGETKADGRWVAKGVKRREERRRRKWERERDEGSER